MTSPSTRGSRSALQIVTQAIALGMTAALLSASADAAEPGLAPSPASWGAGPIMVSLLDSAGREDPIRGVDPASGQPARADLKLLLAIERPAVWQAGALRQGAPYWSAALWDCSSPISSVNFQSHTSR